MGSRELLKKFLDEAPLMVITSAPTGRSHQEVARAALEGGCGAVQLRDKEMGDRDFCHVAKEIKSMCEDHGKLFLINDRVDVALLIGAHGVHLGVEDISPEDARSLVTQEMVVGYSPEKCDVFSGERIPGVDYLGVGPVFGTPSKADAGPPLGLEGLKRTVEKSDVPVIAIGGIEPGNVALVIEEGAGGVAVLSAVADSDDMEEATASLMKELLRHRTGSDNDE